MKRLESATHFTELALDGKVLVRTAGALGEPGTTTRETFHNRAIAARKLQQATFALEQEHYRIVHVPPRAHPRNPALEAAIRAHRDDPAAYQVYADWLQTQGSPWGELIIHELRGATDAAARAALGLPDEDLATIGWRLGLWRSLHINHLHHEDEAFDVVETLRPIFASAMCAVLDELRVGMLRWVHQVEDVPAVLAEAARHPWAPQLRRLRLGDVDDSVDMAHHVVGDVGALIARSFPALETLAIRSGEDGADSFRLDGLALPALTSLTIATCSLSRARLAAVLAAELPQLTTLELWFGSANYGADATVADLAPLLAGTTHARVVHLGLRNAELTDAIARALPVAPIAARLQTLDLSMGTLGDAGAFALAAGRAAFPALRRLDVDDNFLTPGGLAALRSAFADVRSGSQKGPLDGDERYVTVAE